MQAHHLLRTEECLRSSAESERCKEEHYEKICFSVSPFRIFLEIAWQNWHFEIGLSLFDFKQLLFDSRNIEHCGSHVIWFYILIVSLKNILVSQRCVSVTLAGGAAVSVKRVTWTIELQIMLRWGPFLSDPTPIIVCPCHYFSNVVDTSLAVEDAK